MLKAKAFVQLVDASSEIGTLHHPKDIVQLID